MEVEGSFDNWTTRQTMQRSGKDFTIIKLLPPGVYQVLPSCAALLLYLLGSCSSGLTVSRGA